MHNELNRKCRYARERGSPASFVNARPKFSAPEAKRHTIFIWAALILSINQAVDTFRESTSTSVPALIAGFFAVGIFQYMAWYAVFRLLASSNPARPRRLDLPVAVTLCLVTLLPTTRMIWVSATGIGAYLWVFNAGDGKLRAAGIILIALSVQEFWGHLLFTFIGLPVLDAETAFVGTILEFTQAGISWQANVINGRGGHGIVIYTGCSSFANLPLALLCWVTIAGLRERRWSARYFITGLIVAASMILLNMSRLYLMALSSNLFAYWHDGSGAVIFGVGASLTILFVSLYGTKSKADWL